MSTNLPRRHRALVGAILLLAVALALSTAALLDRERAMQQLSKEQVYWSVAQAEIELYRFIATMEAYGRNEADVGHADVVKRFDIFWSRIGLFEAGDIASRALAFPGAAEAVADARAVMEGEEQAVMALRAGDHAEIGRLHARFDEAGLALHRLAVAVNQAETAALADLRRELRVEVVTLVALVGGMVSGGIVLVLLLLRENQRNRALALLNRQFVAASDASPRAIVLCRRQGGRLVVVYANARFRQLVGPGEIEGEEPASLFTGRLGPRFAAPVVEALETGHAVLSDELPLPDEHGWRRLQVTPVAGHDGRETDALMVVVEDVGLEVTTRNEMKASRDAAMRANDAKSRFVAVMSHEIRTPMNGVLGALGLIAQRNRDDELVGLIGTAQASGETLLAILNDILDIARMEAGQLSLDPAPLDLGALVGSVGAAWAPLAAERGVSLTCSVAPEVPTYLAADAARLRQMLVNLVSNAVKFTDTGTIGIDVRPAGGNRYVFEVSDTGAGIAESDVDRLFREYDQLTSHGRGGTGLGLAIVRRLAHLMGGDVGVESQPGKGSRFHFELPLESCAAPASEQAQESPMLVGLHVLVAEDNATNRLIVSEILKDLGCRVRLAANGAEAVDLAMEAMPDIVLMDIAMPVMNGHEAHRRLREGPGAFAALPVVALTAYAMTDEVASFLAEGFDAVLAKPVARETLARTLARLTGRAAPQPVAETPGGGSGEVDRGTLESLLASLDPEIAATLVESFVDDVDAMIGRMEEARSTGDVKQLERESHNVAGLAATFGLIALSREARLVNRACRSGRTDEAIAGVPALAACGRRGLAAFRRITEPPASAAVTAAD